MARDDARRQREQHAELTGEPTFQPTDWHGQLPPGWQHMPVLELSDDELTPPGARVH